MNEDDGTYNGRLLYQYSKPKDFSFMSRSAAIIDGGEYQYLRNRTKISAPTAVQGYQYQASNTMNEGDGTYSAKLLYQYSKPKDFSFSNRSSATEDGGEYQYNSRRTRVTVPASTQGYQYQASNTLNEGDGTYNGRLIYQYGKPVNFQFLSASSAAGTDTQYAYRKSRSVVASPAAQQGYVYNSDNTLNEGDGTYNSVFGVKIPADQYMYSKAQNAFRKSVTSVHTASSTMLAEPTEVQGYAYSRSNRVRPGGLYQTEQLDSTAVAKTVSFTASVTDKQTAYAYQYNNADSLPDATAVQYANVEITGRINDHLMYDYTKTVAVAKLPSSCAGAGATWVTYGRTRGEYGTSLYGSNNVVGLNYIASWRNGYDIFTHVLKFHLTAIAAAAEINMADHNSTISSAGDNLWMSHKITHAFNVLNTYNFSRPEHSQDSIKHVYKKA